VAVKPIIDFIVENTVAQGATVTDMTSIIPNGKTVKINKFGGYERLLSLNTGIIALQFGSGAAWTTLRAGGGGTFEFPIDRTFDGDGAKRFRVVRINKDPVGSVAKEMVAWIEAVIL
jgi:hypothetical protein